jgi:peptide/nickel transport system substrate-binding protein
MLDDTRLVATGRAPRQAGVLRHVGKGIAAAALVAAAGGAALVGSPVAGAAPSAHHASRASKSPKAVSDAMPAYALTIGDIFTWILPLVNQVGYENWDISAQREMWLPLYWAGNGSKTGINYTQSVAKPPVYSDHDRTVTIRLKTNLTWSTGAAITSKDVKFYFQLVDAGKSKLGNYIPGLLPTDLARVTYPSTSTVVLHLKRSYNPVWFTGNQLTWIYPLPVQAWDRTSATAPVGTAATTPAGAEQVLTFLFSQSKDEGTWATNPLWKTVDGPFEISAYNPVTHEATFAANPHYTGPTKPRVAGFRLYSFTTGTAELDALRSGTLTFGYIPFGDLKEIPYFKSHGFAIKPWPVFYNEVVELGFTSKTWGPLVKQLYIRQALQHLINQPGIVAAIYRGYAVPDYGPVPIDPPSSLATAFERKNPYPFSVSAAMSLLREHGWSVHPEGVDTCAKPGTGPGECGAGIPAGARLTLNMLYPSGVVANTTLATYLHSTFSEAGITLNVAPSANVLGTALPCTATQASCSWQLVDFGSVSWFYGNDNYPTGGQLFATGASFNLGGYSNSTVDAQIQATHVDPSVQALYTYEDTIATQLPVLFQPVTPLQVSVIKDDLAGVLPQNTILNLNPEKWYFIK